MPLYAYQCSKCNKIWELMIKLIDFGKEVKCPDCKEKLKRLVCPVRFKIEV